MQAKLNAQFCVSLGGVNPCTPVVWDMVFNTKVFGALIDYPKVYTSLAPFTQKWKGVLIDKGNKQYFISFLCVSLH